MAKKKKEKIIYYDDNSTIIDMSSVNKKGEKQAPPPPRVKSTAREKWNTYWNSMKLMFLHMCVVLSVIAILYILIMLLI